MPGLRRRFLSGIPPFLWLVADAAAAAAIAWPAQTLLLFLLSPAIPLTLRNFAAAMAALLPQVLPVYILAGPLIVLLGIVLSVGRSTTRGLSVRYVLRFALFDGLLLSLAASHQYRSAGGLLPDTARTALALTDTAFFAVTAVTAILVLVDARRPGRVGPAWGAALALGLLVALGGAAELRRVRQPAPVPIDAPGFTPERPALLVEIPGLGPADADGFIARGLAPALEALQQRGARFPVEAEGVSDTLALHATLVTGRDPRHHGLLAAVRYRPLGAPVSFSIFPRSLLLRPLLWTPLWVRERVDHGVLRAVALPGIARALDLPVAVIADPLGFGRANPASVVVPETALAPGVTVALGAAGAVTCTPASGVVGHFFDPTAADLPATPVLGVLVRQAMEQDLCAAAAAQRAVASGKYALVAVRLGGYGRVAAQFAGWREGSEARGATEREIAAYGRTMARYFRELGQAVGAAVDAAGPHAAVAIVSPHGIGPRQDLGRLVEALAGTTGPTGTHAGPPHGFALLAGDGVRGGVRQADGAPLTSLLPTLLWAQGLPAAEDMGPIVRHAFTKEFADAHPVVTVPSYSH